MPVNAADIRRLVPVPSDRTDEDLQPFLDAASLIRTEDLSSSGFSVTRLDMIELYLAAHFTVVAVEFGGLRSWQTGQSKEEYKGVQFDKVGIESTRWGQQAIALDTTGTLIATTQTKGRAEFKVYGCQKRTTNC